MDDVEKSIDFYERLGFSKKWKHEEGAAQCDREGFRTHFEQGCPEIREGSDHHVPRSNKGLEDEFRSSGAEVSFTQWGMKVMVVADPDGNELYFTDDELRDN